MKRTLVCTMQNRLGALDRILGTLTHWGFLTENFESRLEPKTGYIRVSFSFDCPEEKVLEKLMKAIRKQVYVLGIERFTSEAEALAPVLTSLSAGQAKPANVFIPLHAKRRETHASHSSAQ
jgi:acetolactate synthase small subunit